MKRLIQREKQARAGMHPGLSGNCSGLYGDLDACEITATEREAGVDIRDLIMGDDR